LSLPSDWDETFLHAVACSIRLDPHSAHGVPPAQLLMGRKVVYPLEMKKLIPEFVGDNFSTFVYFSFKFSFSSENYNFRFFVFLHMF